LVVQRIAVIALRQPVIKTGVKVEALMKLNEVVGAAEQAKAGGASRFCNGRGMA